MIAYDEKAGTFSLATANSTYQFVIHKTGYLLHTYYGERVDGQDFSYLLHHQEFGFCPAPHDMSPDRAFSLDSQPQEYPFFGAGDFRSAALDVINQDGSRAVDLRYKRHEIIPGKYSLYGLPSFYDGKTGNLETQTLSVWLEDSVTGAEVKLMYGVFRDTDIITRAAIITNKGNADIRLFKAQSVSVDFPYGDFDLIHFHGRHAMEREFERVPVMRGVLSLESSRGASGHMHNPGFILCGKGTDENRGRCYGFNLVYSGSFRANIERDQTRATRVNLGLSGDGFSFLLEPGESFTAPEAVMSFSADGFARLSHNFHRAVRRDLCRGEYKYAPRPVLINNWEATYFDFTGEKLLDIAKEASEIGADMFVLDDGWFGNRDSDNRALGDWTASEGKLGGPLYALVDGVNALGLKFGLWFEPEMVSEDSDLYRSHPDWALATPGRKPLLSRNQLVLDMSRGDVREYLFGAISAVLDSANIEYVKWDMNRSIADRWSASLPPERQGELPHRYMLGLYELLERLTAKYPRVLFEGCSGGGGRFDLGMLHYCPQIWTSDNTDPIARLKIQYGTSFFYPMTVMAAHVSASPNHQNGRSTPIATRGAAALCGAFGFELDVTGMTDVDKAEAKQILALYREYEPLIREGRYYRLTSPYGSGGFTAWQFSSENGDAALVVIIVTDPQANPPLVHVRLKGLAADKLYTCGEREYVGGALMSGGLAIPRPYMDYPAVILHFSTGETA